VPYDEIALTFRGRRQPASKKKEEDKPEKEEFYLGRPSEWTGFPEYHPDMTE